MTIEKVDPELCTGCGLCVDSCPMDVIRMEKRLAVIKYPEDCMTCYNCELDCPENAITVSEVSNPPYLITWGQANSSVEETFCSTYSVVIKS